MDKKDEKQSDNIDSHSANRRKLLGAIAAGGAAANMLPTKWSKPVVDSVLLPAHAQMSPTAPTSVTSALSTIACTVTGWAISSSTSASGFLTGTTAVSYSGNIGLPSAEFTYAAVTGSLSAVATYTGAATASYTVPAVTTGTNQFVPYIFDSTCVF